MQKRVATGKRSAARAKRLLRNVLDPPIDKGRAGRGEVKQSNEFKQEDKGFMSLIKFIFVLLIIVPVAVLMLYLISNLNDKLNGIVKNESREKREEKAKAESQSRTSRKSRTYEKQPSYRQPEHRREPEAVRRDLGGSFSREIPDRDRYKTESPYYIKRQQMKTGEETARKAQDKKNVKETSKRKRRKARKNKRKVREK